jgi:hypothetical protein
MFKCIFSRDSSGNQLVICKPYGLKNSWGILCLLLIVTIIGCGPTLKQASISDPAVMAERDKQQELALTTYVEREKRLYKVGFPLLVEATSINVQAVKPNCGFKITTKDRYPKEYRDIAQRYYNLGDNPIISYVHPRSPAAKAGVKPSDSLVNYDGTVLSGKSYKEITNILDGSFRTKSKKIPVVIQRNGKAVKLQIDPVLCCNYNLILINHDLINALSDGKNIAVTSGLMRAVENDDELAFVLSHEIAHNALGHTRKKRRHRIFGTLLDVAVAATTGVYTNAFSNIGGAAFSKGFEFEADYAGLYIAARAGHDIRGAPNFWRRLAAEHPQAIKKGFGSSHPSTPERFVAMENTIQEIIEKQKLDQPLIPERKQQRSGTETGSTDVPNE